MSRGHPLMILMLAAFCIGSAKCEARGGSAACHIWAWLSYGARKGYLPLSVKRGVGAPHVHCSEVILCRPYEYKRGALKYTVMDRLGNGDQYVVQLRWYMMSWHVLAIKNNLLIILMSYGTGTTKREAFEMHGKTGSVLYWLCIYALSSYCVEYEWLLLLMFGGCPCRYLFGMIASFERVEVVSLWSILLRIKGQDYFV